MKRGMPGMAGPPYGGWVGLLLLLLLLMAGAAQGQDPGYVGSVTDSASRAALQRIQEDYRRRNMSGLEADRPTTAVAFGAEYSATDTGRRWWYAGEVLGWQAELGIHNDLGGLQGGTNTPSAQYYHVNAADYAALSGIAVVSGLLKGAAGDIVAAVAGTDYEVPLGFSYSLSRYVNTVTLTNDTASPGNNKVYATDGSGVRGWYAFAHNSLASLQGGATDEYYHLPAAAHSALTDTHAQLANLHTDTAPTFSGLTVDTLTGMLKAASGTVAAASITSPLTYTTGTLALPGLSSLGTANYAVGVNAGATGWEYKQLVEGANITITHGAGSISIASSASTAAHNLLSAAHSDSTAATVQRGDVITGQGVSPKWVRLALGTVGKVLYTDGTDAAWSASPTLTSLTLNGNLSFGSGADRVISQNTTDGSDNKAVSIGGGGAAVWTRGAYIDVTGNEYTAGYQGVLNIVAGAPGTTSTYDAMIRMFTGNSTTEAVRINRSQQFLHVDGSAAAPAVSSMSDPDTGMTSFGANAYGVVTTGVARWCWDSSGHLLPFAADTYNIGDATHEVGSIYVATNKRIYFGNGQEASIYYDGTKLIITR